MPGQTQVAGFIAATVVGVLGFAEAAGAQSTRAELERELIGAPAYSIDGTPIGEVDALNFDADDEIQEVVVTRAGRLGLGGVTVTIPRGYFITLRGAVVVELTTPDIFKLPAEPR